MALAEVELTSIVEACAALLVLVVAGAVGVLWLRRSFRGDKDRAAQTGGFTLSQLRELHRAGRMTTEEFERAKATVVAAARRQMGGSGPTKRPPSSGGGRDSG